MKFFHKPLATPESLTDKKKNPFGSVVSQYANVMRERFKVSTIVYGRQTVNVISEHIKQQD